MEYNRIIAVTGLPGLFELVTSKTDGAIVRSLDDKSTKFVSSRVHNFSHLESIEIYTQRDNVNLVDIFQSMSKSSEKLPDGKDAAVLKSYFMKIFPEMDFERVYSSDMKKMVKWFEVLQKNEVELKLSALEDEPIEEAAVIEEAEAKPAKAAKKKEEKKTDEKAAAVAEPAREKVKEVVAKKETAKKETEKKEPAKKDAAKAETPKKTAPKKKTGE